MSERSRLVTLNTGRSRPLQTVAGIVVATTFVVLLASAGTARADSHQYSVVARIDANSAGLTERDIVVKLENVSVPAMTIKASPDIPRNIAIVMDAGPDQAKVLSKEKDLAIALMNGLSDPGTSFTVASAATSSKTQAPALDRSVAIEHIREITGDNGERTNVPIYDAIGAAIRQISLVPGLRVVIFVGEGNDGGSSVTYTELRRLAESNHVTVYAALVAEHSLRGARSILRFGWNLQELTGDTAGLFFENQKTLKTAEQIRESVRGLRLITFVMPSPQPGRCKISVSSLRGKRLPAQKAISLP
jgi:hypothetical protein